MSIFNRPTRPNSSNLASNIFLVEQGEKEAQKIADLNAQQNARGADAAYKNIQEFNRLYKLDQSNPESKGVAQEYLEKNMPGFKNINEFTQFLGNQSNLEMGPAYITTFTAGGGNEYLDELNQKKGDILGDRSDLDSIQIVGVRPEWSERHQEHRYMLMVKNSDGVVAAATTGGTPIVDLAADGDMSKVQDNIIKLSRLEFNKAVNDGYLDRQTQAGFSPAVNTDAYGVISVKKEDPDMEAVDAILGTSEEPTSGIALTGDAYTLPGVSNSIQLDPENPISFITKDNGNLVKIDASPDQAVIKDGILQPKAKEYLPLTEEGLEYVDADVLARAQGGEQFYVDPMPANGRYIIYDSSGSPVKLRKSDSGTQFVIAQNAALKSGVEGADAYISKLTTGYDSATEFQTVKNGVINRENVQGATNSIPAGNRAQIRKAIADGDFGKAEELISANTGENLLSEDDQIALLELVQQSNGNLYSLSYDDKAVVAAAMYSAVPKDLRDADLAKSFTYFLETGKLDFNTRQIAAKEANVEIDKLKLAGADRLNDLVKDAAGAQTDEKTGRLTPEGVSTMEAVIRELSAMEADILATGNAPAINKLNRQRINAAGRIAADKLSENNEWFNNIKRFFTREPKLGTVPPGDLVPNVIALDRDENPTNDPNKVQYVRFVEPGTRTRQAGVAISLQQLAKTLGSDEVQALKDVGLYNNLLKQLGTE